MTNVTMNCATNLLLLLLASSRWYLQIMVQIVENTKICKAAMLNGVPKMFSSIISMNEWKNGNLFVNSPPAI
jgi:hypothetical protein